MEIMREVAEALQRLFGSDVEAMAAGTEVIRRRRKFDAISLLRTIVLTVLKHPRPRPADFQRTARQFGVGISKAAMTDRFNDRLVAFLRAVLTRSVGRALAARPANLASFQGFTHVFIGDATTVALPDDQAARFPGCGGTAGIGRAAIKIQLLWEILTGAVRQLVIEAGKSSDATSPIAHEGLPAGSLALFDLGYFCLGRFGRMMRAGASWVSRLQIGVNGLRGNGPGTGAVGRPAGALGGRPTAGRHPRPAGRQGPPALPADRRASPPGSRGAAATEGAREGGQARPRAIAGVPAVAGLDDLRDQLRARATDVEGDRGPVPRSLANRAHVQGLEIAQRAGGAPGRGPAAGAVGPGLRQADRRPGAALDPRGGDLDVPRPEPDEGRGHAPGMDQHPGRGARSRGPTDRRPATPRRTPRGATAWSAGTRNPAISNSWRIQSFWSGRSKLSPMGLRSAPPNLRRATDRPDSV